MSTGWVIETHKTWENSREQERYVDRKKKMQNGIKEQHRKREEQGEIREKGKKKEKRTGRADG